MLLFFYFFLRLQRNCFAFALLTCLRLFLPFVAGGIPCAIARRGSFLEILLWSLLQREFPKSFSVKIVIQSNIYACCSCIYKVVAFKGCYPIFHSILLYSLILNSRQDFFFFLTDSEDVVFSFSAVNFASMYKLLI